MSDVILKIENLSKQYRLGLVGTGSMVHDLNRWWHAIRGKEDPYLTVGSVSDRSAEATDNYVWALRDINFEVKQGEVLGIIGKNGAGKSTLLKILSRVTSPTTGVIKTRGRIASLLEVGTGFHPELTGRENIYLNGAILGMTKAEIRAKEEEIIDFSGCKMYIDTPVKRYSSGMRVRLGFAVAAFLEPDILVVDEVLAVGDAEFQKKAIGKMQDISTGEGRTVLFVSHNMASVQSLCNRCIILRNGNLYLDTPDIEQAINSYLKEDQAGGGIPLTDRLDRKGRGRIKFQEVWFENEQGQRIDQLISGSGCVFNLKCTKDNISFPKLSVSFSVSRRNGVLLSTFVSEVAEGNLSIKSNSENVIIKCRIPKVPFTSDQYIGNVFIRTPEDIEDWILNAFSFDVIDGDFFGTGKIIPSSHKGVLVNQYWSIEEN